MKFSKEALFAITLFVSASACGEDERGTTSPRDGGVTGVIADAGESDGGTTRDGGEARDGGGPIDCDGPVDVTLTNSWGPIEGPYQVYGRIELGQTVPAGTRFQVAYRMFEDSGISTANKIESATTTEETDVLFYRIENIGNLEFWVFARMDLNGDMRIGGGDIGGYYTGDPTTAVTDGTGVPALVVMDASVCNADIAMGPL